MYILAILALLLGMFVGLLLLREPVLRGQSPQWLRPFYLWILPPAELYSRAEMGPVDLAKVEAFEFEFAPQYSGEYEIGIIVDRKIEMPKKTYDFGLSGEIVLREDDDKKSWSRSVGPHVLPWWDVNRNGFAFATFSVPADIPLDHATRFVFRIDTASVTFSRDYGRATMYIGKKPEK